MTAKQLSAKEILGQLYSDLSKLKIQIQRFDRSEVVLRTLKKAKKRGYLNVYREYKAEGGYSYGCVFAYRYSKEGNIPQWYCTTSIIRPGTKDSDFAAILLFPDLNKAITFPWSFFEDYKHFSLSFDDWKLRRDLKLGDITKAVPIFFERNYLSTWYTINKRLKDTSDTFALVADGILLLEQVDESTYKALRLEEKSLLGKEIEDNDSEHDYKVVSVTESKFCAL